MATEFDDTPEYLRDWAKGIAKATTKMERRLLYDGYRKRANNKKLPKGEREGNLRRAKALKRHL
jgi:hypothetical protein